MQIQNEGDDEQSIPSDFTVVDTLDNRYRPIESDSDYALDLGGRIGPATRCRHCLTRPPGPDRSRA